MSIKIDFIEEKIHLNLLLVADIYKKKEHLTKIGYIKILNLLYNVPNKYFKPKEYWLDLLEKRT